MFGIGENFELSMKRENSIYFVQALEKDLDFLCKKSQFRILYSRPTNRSHAIYFFNNSFKISTKKNSFFKHYIRLNCGFLHGKNILL